MRDKKQQIIKAATQAVKQDGLRSVSFRTLADEVQVKSSSVHYHFPTKHDLAAALVEDYTASFVERLREIDLSHRSLVRKLEAVVDLFAEVLAADDLCLCGMLAAEVTSLDDTTRHALRQFFAQTEHWLQMVLKDHQQDLRPGFTADQAAKALLCGLEGALLIDRADNTTSRLDAMRVFARTLAN